MTDDRFFLVRSKGELHLTASLDGYPKATVIAEDVPFPPSEFARWKDGQWVEDEAAKAKAERTAAARAMPREELVARLDELAAKVAELEAKLP